MFGVDGDDDGTCEDQSWDGGETEGDGEEDGEERGENGDGEEEDVWVVKRVVTGRFCCRSWKTKLGLIFVFFKKYFQMYFFWCV